MESLDLLCQSFLCPPLRFLELTGSLLSNMPADLSCTFKILPLSTWLSKGQQFSQCQSQARLIKVKIAQLHRFLCGRYLKYFLLQKGVFLSVR
jgi:hypothetical protein